MRWGGLVICLLIVATYIVSSYRRIAIVYESLPERYVTFQVNMGQLGFLARWGPQWGRSPVGPSVRPEIHDVDGTLLTSLLWRFTTMNLGRGQQWISWHFPLWPIFIITATVAGVATIRRRRTVRFGRCPSCNYDLSGLPPGSPCPECAAAAPSPPDH
jgi:hypothetical protein